jgi:hypothetical protein
LHTGVLKASDKIQHFKS